MNLNVSEDRVSVELVGHAWASKEIFIEKIVLEFEIVSMKWVKSANTAIKYWIIWFALDRTMHLNLYGIQIGPAKAFFQV